MLLAIINAANGLHLARLRLPLSKVVVAGDVHAELQGVPGGFVTVTLIKNNVQAALCMHP